MRLDMSLAVEKGQKTGVVTYAFNISAREERQASLCEFKARNFLYRVGKQINKFLKEEKREREHSGERGENGVPPAISPAL